MAFARACGLERGEPLSNAGVQKPDGDFRPRSRPYVTLRRDSDFRRVYREGHRARCGAVTVIAAAGQAGPAQVAVVAGRKVGGAVRRNVAKRRLREAVARVALEDGRAYVVVAGPEVPELGFGDLMAAIDDAAGRAQKDAPKEEQ